jgi:hypothetical protein
MLQDRAMLAVPLAAAVSAFVYNPAGKIEALLYPPRLAAMSGDPIHVVNRVIDVRGVLELHSEQHGEITVWVPTSSDQCWDAPLPCTPELTQEFISPRRAGSLDQGFIKTLK